MQTDLVGAADLFCLPMESCLSHGSGGNLLPHFISLVCGSVECPKRLFLSGSMAFQGAVNCVYKFAGGLFLLFSDGSNKKLPRWLGISHDSLSRSRECRTCRKELARLQFGYISQFGDGAPVLLAKVAISTIGRLWKEIEQLHSYPILSLTTALVPPSDYISLKISSLPSKNPGEQLGGTMEQAPNADDCRGCKGLSLSKISSFKDTVEPKTGVKFPTVLDNHLFGEDTMEWLYYPLLVMVVLFTSADVQPDSVCKKLRRKYASVPVGELKNSYDFYSDLL
ncbi:hypothetical protein Taro_010474, partial [Colocasia esculenta]|nr:hypothetical protein [Colocasia esculenta]